MTDPIRKADALSPETSPLDVALIAALITAEIGKLQADPDAGDIVDALTARIPILSRAISAARIAGSVLEKDTHPAEIARRAAANDSARKASEERSKEWSRKLEARANQRAAEEMVGKCRDGLDRAQGELARLVKGNASDRDVVLAEGSVALWTDRLAKAEQNLTAMAKGTR